MITVTTEAAKYIQTKLLERGKGVGIRLSISPAGCSGFSYGVEYVDDVQEDDEVFESNDVIVVTDPRSLVYLQDTEIGYVTENLSEGLQFNNPNATASCGCGESFSV